jgi:hypothetical protein
MNVIPAIETTIKKELPHREETFCQGVQDGEVPIEETGTYRKKNSLNQEGVICRGAWIYIIPARETGAYKK